jgi:hypothetical protein
VFWSVVVTRAYKATFTASPFPYRCLLAPLINRAAGDNYPDAGGRSTLFPILAVAHFTTDVRESNVVISVEHEASHFVHSHFCVRAQ